MGTKSGWNRDSGRYNIAKKMRVQTVPKKKEEPTVKHDEVFYFWVESMLSINKIDTDAEIRKRFLERMSEEEATFYLGQRKKALKEGSEFKLERYGLDEEEEAVVVSSSLGDTYHCNTCGMTHSTIEAHKHHVKNVHGGWY